MTTTLEAPAGDDSQAVWEAAYARFETAEQETQKFLNRLRMAGVDGWDKSLCVAEIFCGRGNGLVALERLGFRCLLGLDLSPHLATRYQGPAEIVVADARRIPWSDGCLDVAIVQGGLHHLPQLDDLRQAVAELARVLRPTGRLVVVEPWQTPFLRFVHLVCRQKMALRCSKKLDALATMIVLETPTYQRWLAAPDEILAIVSQSFEITWQQVGWGKLMLVANPRGAVARSFSTTATKPTLSDSNPHAD